MAFKCLFQSHPIIQSSALQQQDKNALIGLSLEGNKRIFPFIKFFSNFIICHNDVWWRGWLGNWVFWVCSNTWKFKVALICSLWWVSSLSCESSIFLLSCTLTCESETIECKIEERCLARSLSISIKFEKYCIFGDGGIRCFRVTPFVESKEVIFFTL